MSNPPCKTELLRAALERKGAPSAFIDTLLAKLEKLAKSPEEFKKWNSPLDAKSVQVLNMLRGPNGDMLAEVAVQSMLAAISQHYGISPDELKSFGDLN